MRRRLTSISAYLVITAVLAGSCSARDDHSPRQQSSAINSVTQLAQRNPTKLVAQTMRNELNADLNDHSLWTYIEDKVDGNKHTVKKIVETPKGDAKLLITANGRPLSPDQLRRQDARLNQIAHDPQVFAREQQAEHQDERKAREHEDDSHCFPVQVPRSAGWDRPPVVPA